MNHPVTQEDSYADRRQLFKDIWDTSVENKHKDKKEINIKQKPKVIKTLRLDNSVSEKKKKQRFKNLKIVCNKLLNLGDKCPDEMFYKQIMKQTCKDRKKFKTRRVRKAKKTNIILTPTDSLEAISTSSRFLTLNIFSSSSSQIKIDASSSYKESDYKRRRRRWVQKFPDPKIWIRSTPDTSNKRLFPINKITIE